MVDVRAPAAADANQSDVRVTDAPPIASSPRQPSSQPTVRPTAPAAGSVRGRRLRPLVERLRAAERAIIAWSHTRRALRIGTAVVVALGATAAVALLLIGALGVGTHTPTWYSEHPVDTSAGGETTNILTPPQVFGNADSGMQYGPFAPPPLDLNNTVAQLVLQPADLPDGFAQLPGSDTGADPGRGLLASYHDAYQRQAPTEGSSDATIGVFTFAGLYRDDESALLQIDNLDPDSLAREAGRPDMAGRFVSAATVGDGSTVVHLAGNVAGVQVGVYIVAFRRGAVEGIVGVAAPLGSESLDTALQLANAQEARIEAHVPASGG